MHARASHLAGPLKPDNALSNPRLLNKNYARHASTTSRRMQLRPRGLGAAAASDGEAAIVLVDHGSRRQEANDMLEQFAEVYRATSKRSMVRIAHMELASPTLADAIAQCAADGASTVVVAPFFLSRGRHITEDIPALVQAAAADHPLLTLIVADPLGTDELLAQLIEKRVQHAATPVTES